MTITIWLSGTACDALKLPARGDAAGIRVPGRRRMGKGEQVAVTTTPERFAQLAMQLNAIGNGREGSPRWRRLLWQAAIVIDGQLRHESRARARAADAVGAARP